MLRIVSLLAVLLVPAGVSAAWVGSGNQVLVPQVAKQTSTHTWTTLPSSSGDQSVSACNGKGTVTFDASISDGSADAAVDMLSCDVGASDSQCPVVASFRVGVTGETRPVNLPRPILRAKATAAALGGDIAQVTFTCESKETMGGITGAMPGLGSDGYGDERTLEVVYTRRGPVVVPNWPEFFFSTDATGFITVAGNDSNPCTLDLPCLTLNKIETLLNRHQVIIRLDNGDTADNSPDVGLSTFDGWQLDNTGCGTGGVAMEDTPCGFVLPYRPDVPDLYTIELSYAANVLGRAATNTFISVNGSGSGYFGLHGFRVDNCPRVPILGATGFSRTVCVAIGDAGASSQGHLVLGNVFLNEVTGVHPHGVRLFGSLATFVGFNLPIVTRDQADFDEDCVGAQCASSDPNPAVLCGDVDSPYDECSPGTSQLDGSAHPLETEAPGFTLLSNRVIQMKTTQLNSTAQPGIIGFVDEPVPVDGHSTIIGPHFRFPAAITTAGHATSLHACVWNLGAAAAAKVNQSVYARILCQMTPALLPNTVGFFFDSLALGGATTTNALYFNTVLGAKKGVASGAAAATSSRSVTMRGNLIDELDVDGSGDAFVVSFAGASAGALTWDADGSNVYDLDDGAQSFECNATEYDTAAEVPRTACDAGSNVTLNASFFGSTFGGGEGPLESDGNGGDLEVGADGDQFMGLSATAACANGQECDRGAPGVSATMAFHVNAWLPSAYTDGVTPLRGVRLTGAYTNAGAR